MSCCGGKSTKAASTLVPTVEYRGTRGAYTVKGRTGKVYHFGRTGARLDADRRDLQDLLEDGMVKLVRG